uniref:Uncharacterized protein n=1 Tax=Glossina pallidipes TaxID=7398 RepID=A0A1B0A8U1_GLOPL
MSSDVCMRLEVLNGAEFEMNPLESLLALRSVIELVFLTSHDRPAIFSTLTGLSCEISNFGVFSFPCTIGLCEASVKSVAYVLGVGSTSSVLCSGTNVDVTNAIVTFLRSSEMLYETLGSFAVDSWKVSLLFNLWRPSDDSNILRSKSNLSFILDSLLIICANNVLEFPPTFDILPFFIEFLLPLSGN